MELSFDEVDENETIVRISMAMPRFPFHARRMQPLDMHSFLYSVWMIGRWQWQEVGVHQFLNDLDMYFLARANFCSWNEFLERLEDNEMVDSPTNVNMLVRMQGA